MALGRRSLQPNQPTAAPGSGEHSVLSPRFIFHVEQKQPQFPPLQCGISDSLDAMRPKGERNGVPSRPMASTRGQGETFNPAGKPAALPASSHDNPKGDLLFEEGLLASPHCMLGRDSPIAKYLEIHELTLALPSALRRKELQILENVIKGCCKYFPSRWYAQKVMPPIKFQWPSI